MRREPRQERSRQMVERLLAAGRSVLVDDGYDAFTTNRVAAAAGVSPGSLYQYFPDKSAILDALTTRWVEDVSERVTASLTDRLETLGPTMVREVLDALLAALESDRELLRVVMTELPAVRFADRRAHLERRVTDVLTALLVGRTSRPVPALSAWLLVIALEMLSVRWTLEPPPHARDQVLDELQALVLAYLS